MYIKKVTLKNIRCFEGEVSIDLSTSESIKKWAVILGDNGAGKTTLLRCIALGICDEDQATALFEDLGTNLIRHDNQEDAEITLELWSKEKEKYIVTTKISHSDDGTEDIERLKDQSQRKNIPWNHLFVCGYGANRGIGGGDEPGEKYSIANAVYTLIDYESYLLDYEKLLWRTTFENIERREQICKWLHYLLILPENVEIKLTEKGLRIITASGLDIPIYAYGDGYEATVTWIIDMLSRFIQAKSMNPSKLLDNLFSGIILIDELEQHLHPRWQKEIIRRLAMQFPNIQFIATTHSPLCAIGTTDLEDDNCCLVSLLKENERVITHIGLPPRGKRADQVLTSYLFGLTSTRDSNTVQKIEEYAALSGKNQRSYEENQTLKDLQRQLMKILGSPETELQNFVEHAVHRTIKEMTSTEVDENQFDSSAIGFEIRRQLAELFGRGEIND